MIIQKANGCHDERRRQDRGRQSLFQPPKENLCHEHQRKAGDHRKSTATRGTYCVRTPLVWNIQQLPG